MAKISAVWAREILDSRGNPTIEVEVVTENSFGSAAAPSGASTGIYEAVELRDSDNRYFGKGVKKAVETVIEVIGPALVGRDVLDQEDIDRTLIELDGTENKSNLGGNAIVATSMAALRAAANSVNKPLYAYLGGSELPFGLFNILNGGKHAGNLLAIQEFMVVPTLPTFSERLRAASEIYHTLKKLLVSKYGVSAKNIGDEGGFAPPISQTHDALDLVFNAMEEAGYSKDCRISLDCAASTFYKEGKYAIDGHNLDSKELLEFYLNLSSTYPLLSIEDPFHEEDFESFHLLKNSAPFKVVADDLTVSNPKRVRSAVEKDALSALLLKVNQVGTVTEALESIDLCRGAGIDIIVSHRSGETEDVFIADFSVGVNSEYIKAGAPARGERTAKYNQLLRIEEMLSLNG